MRICLHTIREISRDTVGGTERFLVGLASELRSLGHDAYVLCSGMSPPFAIDGVPIYSAIPERFRRGYLKVGFANSRFVIDYIAQGTTSREALRRLSEYTELQLSTVTYDVAHLNSFASSLFLADPSRLVITNHENELEYDSRWGTGFTRHFEELVRNRETNLHNAGCLTTPSRYYAVLYSEHLGLSVTTIGGGICLSSFDRSAIRQREMRPPPADRAGKMFVLMSSRFDPHQKGHDVALRACSHLKELGIDAEFHFTGMRDDYRGRLADFRDSANALGVSERVFVARYEQIQEAYEECDVAISPERYCSYGLSISETLSLGIPTVLSAIPTYREIAGKYRHAFFFEPDDARELAFQIIRANDLIRSVRESEAVRFRMDHDLRCVARRLGDLYLSVIQSSGRS